LTAISLGGCGGSQFGSLDFSAPRLDDQECLARVMYFESNRSSDDGMMAVGTVVMNRLDDPRYPKTVCGVVGQPAQFAEGALSKPVMRRSASWARATRIAEAVLSGERHDKVGEAKFFHTAGYTFPYRNMHYLTLAGGNVFYEKKTPGTFVPVKPWELGAPTMLASNAKPRVEPASQPLELRPTMVASIAKPQPERSKVPLRPTVLAAAEPSPKRPPLPGVTKTQIVPQAFKPGAIQVAGLNPSAKPKPIVLAMLSEHGAPLPPRRTITDLIERDTRRR
jgi:hypothetical protein